MQFHLGSDAAPLRRPLSKAVSEPGCRSAPCACPPSSREAPWAHAGIQEENTAGHGQEECCDLRVLVFWSDAFKFWQQKLVVILAKDSSDANKRRSVCAIGLWILIYRPNMATRSPEAQKRLYTLHAHRLAKSRADAIQSTVQETGALAPSPNVYLGLASAAQATVGRETIPRTDKS